MTNRTSGDMEELVRIVSAADGQLVGRTRLQKTVYLLELAGLGSGYHFGHRFHGPYSEELGVKRHVGRRHMQPMAGSMRPGNCTAVSRSCDFRWNFPTFEAISEGNWW